MMRGAAEVAAELIKDLQSPLFLLFSLGDILKITKKGEFFSGDHLLNHGFFKIPKRGLVFMVALNYVHMQHNSIKE